MACESPFSRIHCFQNIDSTLAVLCGTPNHGVFAAPAVFNSEWNGMGHFLARLNAISEVHPDVLFVTTRSDKNDKYAQPTGEFIGQPGALVILSRPRGYIGHGRDTFLIEGEVPEGVNKGVAGTASASKIYPAGTSRAVKVVLNEEALTVKINAEDKGHKIIVPFHY